MFCVICGTVNPDYAKFCRKCGKPVPEEREESAPPVLAPTVVSLHRAMDSPPHRAAEPNQEFAAQYRQLTFDQLASLKAGADDLIPEARIALEAELSSRPEPPTIDEESRGLPYRWGKFQGCVGLAWGIIAAIALVAYIFGAPLSETWKDYAITSPLLIVTCYAIVRRKKYAVTMTYVWIGLSVLIFLAALFEGLTNKALTPEEQGHVIGTGLGQTVRGVVYWGLCAIYYHKRRAEFS